MDLYVYYKVQAGNVEALQGRVGAMQARLGREGGVFPALKRRLEVPAFSGDQEQAPGLQTWMEIYPDTPAGFEAALDLAGTDARLSELIEGPRNIERFLDILPCA